MMSAFMVAAAAAFCPAPRCGIRFCANPANVISPPSMTIIPTQNILLRMIFLPPFSIRFPAGALSQLHIHEGASVNPLRFGLNSGRSTIGYAHHVPMGGSEEFRALEKAIYYWSTIRSKRRTCSFPEPSYAWIGEPKCKLCVWQQLQRKDCIRATHGGGCIWAQNDSFIQSEAD